VRSTYEMSRRLSAWINLWIHDHPGFSAGKNRRRRAGEFPLDLIRWSNRRYEHPRIRAAV